MSSADTIYTFVRHPSQSRARFVAWLGEVCVIALICASITVPPFKIGGLDIYLKTEQVLLPLIFGSYGWMLLAGYARPIRFNGLFVAGAIYSVSIAISISYGAVMFDQAVLLRDFYEIPKVWLPVLFFTIAYETELSEAALRRLIAFFGFATVLVCLYAWGQWANVGITYTLNQLYSTGNHDDVLFRARRVYSTVGNANLLGMLMVWSLATFVMTALNTARNRGWNMLLALACLITLAMTGSRYGLITGGLVYLSAFALPSTSPRRRATQLKVLLVLLPVLALAFYVVATSNPHTLERFQTLRNPAQADSLRDRLDRTWLDAEDEIVKSPLFGRGPAKSFFAGLITDSEYLDVLKQFGIVGFLPYFAYFVFPLFLLWRGLQVSWCAGPELENRMPGSFATLRFCTIIVVTAIVMNIGETTFYDVPLQGFLWLWMGVGARCAITIRQAAGTKGYLVSARREIAPAA